MRKRDSKSNFRRWFTYVPVALSLSACADLVVTDVHHEPFVTTARQVKTTVKNEGNRPAPASTTRLEVKPAGSTTFTRQATASTPALNPGQEVEFFISTLSPAEIPKPASGQCLELKSCADVGNVVPEGWFWETNNCLSRSYCN